MQESSDGKSTTLGEYKYNGGVIAMGPGDQGVMYEFMEGALGDQADTNDILAAIAKFNSPDKEGRSKL
eukprot:m.43448 g.43448  ORF g.43448 m.43448 type:complete len:68 (+) comp19376_c0_seq2:665-868(+)